MSVYSEGETGAKKSSVAALCQQHWGAEMDHDHLPLSWISTPNAIETVMFHAKDALLVIDEFKPIGSVQDKHRWHQGFDRIMRNHANGQGRGRLNTRSELLAAHPSRCLPLATGEEKVSGQSLNARMLTIEIPSRDKPDAIKLDRLTICQKDAKRGLYAQAMAGFVRWMAGKYKAIERYQQELAEAFREQARTPGMHDRTPVIIGELGAALAIYFDFAQEVGAITAEQHQALWEQCWQALCACGAQQPDHQDQHRPEVQIRRLLASLIATKQVHLASVDGSPPADSKAWGWEANGCSAAVGTLRNNSIRIGWVAPDGKSLYLDPDATYSAASQLAQKLGEGLHATRETLQKRMFEHGVFKDTEMEKRREYTMRKKIEGISGHKVWVVGIDFISGETEPEMSDDAAIDGTENGTSPMSA